MILTRLPVRLLLGVILTLCVLPTRAENWPCWRGPRGDGTSLDTKAPLKWTDADIAWKVELPGVGHASAIVWDECIFTATGFKDTTERALLCLDRATGKPLWRETVVKGPLEPQHKENSHASGTPATDGERVYACFRVGDEIVVAAHDFKTGKQLWLERPGTHDGGWGFSMEPVLYKDKVIVDGDSKGDSFLVALNKADGKTAWRVKRTNKGISYAAPLIREIGGRAQLVQCGDRRVTGFDPETGEELWTVDGPSEENVSTPVYSEKTGLFYISSSWPARHIFAIRPNGRGNVTQSHLVWRDEKGAPYVPSMIVAGDYLLSINNSGVMHCYDAATGKVHWTEKVGRTHASPVLVNGLVYFTNDLGTIDVVKPGPAYERVARMELGEPCYGSPAVVDGQLFIRGFKHLICIGKRQ